MSDTHVLVAPRPLRVNALTQRPLFSPVARMLSPPVEALSLVKLADGESQPGDGSDEISPPSGRNTASPRLNLSPDALEEFLSILRPSFFSPNPPMLRARRHDVGFDLGSSVERPNTFRSRDGSHSKSPSITSYNLEDRNTMIATGSASPASDARQGGDNDQLVGNLWRIPGILESPVSRTHTRNPFQRHPSYDAAFSGVFASHLSPSLLPLPASPSPAPLSLSSPTPPTEIEEKDT